MSRSIKNIDAMIESLVENALDFLGAALQEIETKPKFAVLHFHTAVEQFLKARLMQEHWSLTVTRNAAWENFTAGDFQSVTLDNARRRLADIVGYEIEEDAFKSFERVRSVRNMVQHFYAAVYSDDANSGDALRTKVITNLFYAWHYLRDLLLKHWKDDFALWADEIVAIDKSISHLDGYLESAVDKGRKAGLRYTRCSECDKLSVEDEFPELLNDPYQAVCIACKHEQTHLNMKCTREGCEKIVRFVDSNQSVCDCGTENTTGGADHLAVSEVDTPYRSCRAYFCESNSRMSLSASTLDDQMDRRER